MLVRRFEQVRYYPGYSPGHYLGRHRGFLPGEYPT